MSTPKRFDGFVNVLTGLGRSQRDKRVWAVTEQQRMKPNEAEANWLSDPLLARIVEDPVDDMLRGGFHVLVQEVGEELDRAEDANESGPDPRDGRTDALPSPVVAPAPKPKPGPLTIDDTGREIGDLVDAAAEDIGVLEKVAEALKLERGTGGGAILIGAEDGTDDLRKPLNYDTIRSVLFLTVLSPREVIPFGYYNDPRKPRYGEPMIYQLQPATMPVDPATGQPTAVPMTYVHESRLIVFPGIQTTRYERLARAGWGVSVVERVFEAVRDYTAGMQGSSALVADFAQAVIKIKGLAEIYEANDESVLRTRMEAIDMGRSVLRAMLLDADGEDFERKPTPLTGLPEIIDRLQGQVAGAAKVPVTRLFGKPIGGLNATGDADVRNYYDEIDAKRSLRVRPALEKIVRCLFKAKDGPTKGIEPETWSVAFPPLWQPTAGEKALERKTVAETDAIYIDKGVLTPEEVAVSRFGGDDWSPETVLDLDGREVMAEADPEDAPIVDDPKENETDPAETED